MVGLPANDMTTQAAMFKQYDVGGATLMTSPVNPYDGSIERFKTVAASLGVQPLVAVDEEGGDVQRFTDLGSLPSPEQVAASMSLAQAQTLIMQHGLKLKAIGVDMILGPLADVGPSAGGGVLGNRVFSDNPETVASYDLAYIKGWRSAGLLTAIKHFPGMGSASANTDYAFATTPPLSYLEQRDFVPYRELSDTGMAVMVGNQNVPGWFSGSASLSPAVDKYLRQTLGYKNNLIITDSLSAMAITNVMSQAQAIDDAIKAGNDMAIFVELPSSSLSDNQKIIVQAEHLIKSSIQSGELPKQQVVSSVLRKLNAQHIQSCSIKIK